MLVVEPGENLELSAGPEESQVDSPPNETAFNLATDDAVLALGTNNAFTCAFCATSLRSRSGWTLQVSGVAAEEVQRVAIALLQHVGSLDADGDVVQGDKYVVEGSALAVGPEATAGLRLT